MKEYMLSVFTLSAVFAFFSHLSYKSALDGACKFAVGVITFAVTASPILGFISSAANADLSEIIPPAGEIESGDEELFEEAFAEGIKSILCEKFELKPDEVRVLIEGFDKSEWKSRRIRVILRGTAALADYRKIEEYINKMEIGECVTEIEIG